MLVSASLADEMAAWIADKVREAGCAGAVLGISGGIDSAVAAALALRGLGRDAVLGLILPCHSVPQDEEHARLVIDAFGLNAERVDLGPAFDALLSLLPQGDGLAVANLKPRLRMLTFYYYANLYHYLVIGTSNRSELSVGYFTKYGDGGSDIMPLGNLLKRDVRNLARLLGVPEPVMVKAPSGGLWAGQTDEGEMGITYEMLDHVLRALDIGDMTGLATEDVTRVRRMVAASEHKRESIPIFGGNS